MLLCVTTLSACLLAANVRFQVTAPPGTPDEARLFISGDLDALGRWKPDGLPLVREDDAWIASVQLPEGPFEWKVTLGSWERCETRADGNERPNRSAVASEGATFEATVEAWRRGDAPRPASSATGTFRPIGPIAASPTDTIAARSVLVRLPAGYNDPASAERRYPVLYMLDGQNLFDAATSFAGVEWRADETIDVLVAEGAIEPCFIVAIPNSPRRIDELTFTRDPDRNAGGEGAAFLAWLLDEVKPRIDREFRTRPEAGATTIAGSSLGGLFALEAIARRGDRFGRAVAMSPSLWWAEEALLEAWARDAAARPRPIALWIDMGSAEGRASAANVEQVKRLAALFEGSNALRLFVDEGGRHHEADWSRRLPEALRFALRRSE